MATAKKAKKVEQQNLVQNMTRHFLHGEPMCPELERIWNDDDLRQEFLENNSLDPQILERYEKE